MQMQAIKERAKQHLAEVLEQAGPGRFSNYTSSSGSSSSSYGSGTVDTRQLRAKLEAAINVMQTGLVERDTEVGVPGCVDTRHVHSIPHVCMRVFADTRTMHTVFEFLWGLDLWTGMSKIVGWKQGEQGQQLQPCDLVRDELDMPEPSSSPH
jgi:hypothetical protein